jgi:hypothetical protein
MSAGTYVQCVRPGADCTELLDGIPRNDFAVPLRTELRRAGLGFEVNVVKAEALAIAVRPLVIIEQAPEEITFDGVAFGGGAMQVGEVIAQIHHAVGVLDASARG